MTRAVFFDFYGVWKPDIFAEYLAEADQHGAVVAGAVAVITEKYFHGQATIDQVAETLRLQLGRPDIDASQFAVREQDVSPAIVTFMRNLHGHFLKLGVLANLGTQEYEVLTQLNSQEQLFEVIGGPLPFRSDKPLLSQEIFAQALQTIGEPPRSCLMVSGNPIYLHFAQSLGIAAVPYEGFPKLQQTIDQLLASETPQ